MDASLLPAASVSAAGFAAIGGQPAMAGVPGDLPADFGCLLAGLLGGAEAVQGATPEGDMTPEAGAMVEGLGEARGDSMANGMEQGAALSVPDLLARMVPQPQPIPAMTEASLSEGAPGLDAPAPLLAAASTGPTPTAPELPASMPAAAGRSPGAVLADAAETSGGHIATGTAQPTAEPPGLATEALDTSSSPVAITATASAKAPARPGSVAADPVPALPASTKAASQADAPRALPGAAPLTGIGMPTEPNAVAPIATPMEPPPPAAIPDPAQPVPIEAIAAAPETPAAATTGGTSASTLGAPAPEPPAAPARPAAPVPWPARQVVPFAVSLALGSDDRISLTLDPVELGRVEVAISRGAEAHVSLRAERPETLALLQRDRAELERALAGTGFGAEGRMPNLSFGLGFGGSGEDRRDRRPAARDGQGARPAPHTPAPTIQQAAPTARGLIDLAF